MLQITGIPFILVLGLLCVCVYKYIIWPCFASPLAKVPKAHPIAAVSPVWILWKRWHFQELSAIHEAHQKYGPVVRLGPSELSVNCVDGGIRTVYSGGFDKHEWYPNIFDNYG
jgi:hypothetical protein